MVSFNEIPSNIRVPLCYIEIDNSAAVTGTPPTLHKTLLLGLRGTTGQIPAGEPFRITSANAAEMAFGRGSMLSEMAAAFIKGNAFADLWAIAVDDDPDGVKATGKVKLLGKIAQTGQVALMVAGVSVRVTVKAGDELAAAAIKIRDAINANEKLPVKATIETPTDTVVLTAKWSGETGNDIDVRFNYYSGELLPAGLDINITPMTNAVGNPDLSTAITSLGDTWWNYVVNPFIDTLNLNLLRDELKDRWGALKMIDGICWQAKRGTLAQASTFGLSRNDYLFSTMATGIAPQPPYIWASTLAAVAVGSLSIDPARPLQTLQLPGILPPPLGDRWALNERNLLLYDGISTFNVDTGGNVQIERMITMYRENSFGDPDPSYLDVETIATLSYLRYATRVRITQKFPRHKLADDGIRVSPGQAIVTPSVIKAELLALFTEQEFAGLVEDFESFKKTLLVERDPNERNRVNVRSNPDLVNQFRIYAHAIQFIL
ncbi:phage tail sheath subtilisin-like domain-containing protein [Providencia hangzhouensis]|uniref:Mu-like prophage tail sheath protein gpL n=1 Tax=Providencia rettgeri TaxID=587 RepID=A0A9N8GYE0_PRORE|nr:phage tail sheath subtilisin-like domain-containing protein [Providencia rettgeri]CAB5645894.1 Mu-like prophage tail sheath protein gpL [Providencia rettgeri]CAB5713032.1 Mu-like prophage tail sheath protein gpL [Providencia rettgeri]CAC9220530.1 Mu-like prophage tail sheath protein gpL [Providencia rettgeri]CAC9269076.1 Mu-like prophage tail sheath protein gpL [Providencia rettgeri]